MGKRKEKKQWIPKEKKERKGSLFHQWFNSVNEITKYGLPITDPRANSLIRTKATREACINTGKRLAGWLKARPNAPKELAEIPLDMINDYLISNNLSEQENQLELIAVVKVLKVNPENLTIPMAKPTKTMLKQGIPDIMPYPIPTECIYCGAEVNLVSNAKIYGREYGNGKCYACSECDSYVGVHPDLVTPLGILANPELRELKKKAHALFDPLWKSKKMSRKEAYRVLAAKLCIPIKECHIGWFNKEMVIKAISVLKEKEKHNDRT